jgi:hypothetical protein
MDAAPKERGESSMGAWMYYWKAFFKTDEDAMNALPEIAGYIAKLAQARNYWQDHRQRGTLPKLQKMYPELFEYMNPGDAEGVRKKTWVDDDASNAVSWHLLDPQTFGYSFECYKASITFSSMLQHQYTLDHLVRFALRQNCCIGAVYTVATNEAQMAQIENWLETRSTSLVKAFPPRCTVWGNQEPWPENQTRKKAS